LGDSLSKNLSSSLLNDNFIGEGIVLYVFLKMLF